MKILELEIQEVRGIRSLKISPNGRNFAVYGQNGSGKSAVIDAIDFLLTGKMSRLTGAGTGGITLKRYGAHVDADPDASYVSAKIEVPGVNGPVQLIRHMSKPDELQYDTTLSPKIAPILEMASRGQHILTRREILRYVTAEASTRAEKIQELLNISDIENMRRSFVKVQSSADEGLRDQRIKVETAQAAVCATLQTDTFDERQLLEMVNRNRKILGGRSLTRPISTEIQSGIALPRTTRGKQTINVTILEKDIQNLENLESENQIEKIASLDGQLRSLLASIRSDVRMLQALSRIELLQLGIALIDESGGCPLCETSWPPGELAEQIRSRLLSAEAALPIQEEIHKTVSSIKVNCDIAIASLEKLMASLAQAGLETDVRPFLEWNNVLKEFNRVISDPVKYYPSDQFVEQQVGRLFSPAASRSLLKDVLSKLQKKYPKASPEQTAWDTLTRLAENLTGLEAANRTFAGAEVSQLRANTLLESFLAARDEVLGNLYNEIGARFSELYRGIHGPDEGAFDAEIRPEGAGLSFKVDFYGRGKHPPHALHSEGHQDSMGICLYLALAERITQGLIQLVILDDVVMSVDSSHRRKVCGLFSHYFPDKQFIITTHDKTWSNELKSEGVIRSNELIEFYNWTVDTGPHVNYEPDIWDRLENYLRSDDVPGASALLRRGLEEFFALACDALATKVRYRLDGRNDLGDFLPAAMGQYRSLLKKAKQSANSWSNAEVEDQLNRLDENVTDVYSRTNAEQWALNANVHFNNWTNFSKEDFVPLVNALRDLQRLFICPKCESLLRLAQHDFEPVGVICNCGNVNWNLVTKSRNGNI